MPVPVTTRDCGPLLNLADLLRQLHLNAPVPEGAASIPVAQIAGSVSRAHDFDGCFRPLTKVLRKRLQDIENAAPSALDEPIEVVRVDRAYFVADGHKRVALARKNGREFIDARVSRLRSPYEFTPDVDVEAIERTAREGELRRHTGLADGVPGVRFALREIDGYGELLHAVQAFAYDMALRTGQLPSRAEAARAWYEDEYLPMVERGRKAVGGLIDGCSDADVYLAMLRHTRAWWGTDCDAPECAADMLLADRRREASARMKVSRILRAESADREPVLLPLAGESDDSAEPARS